MGLSKRHLQLTYVLKYLVRAYGVLAKPTQVTYLTPTGCGATASRRSSIQKPPLLWRPFYSIYLVGSIYAELCWLSEVSLYIPHCMRLTGQSRLT